MMKQDLTTLRRYHRCLRPFIGIFLISIVFDICMTLMGLSAPLLTRVLFDYAYQYRDLALLNITVLATIAVYFVYFFLSVTSDYLQIYINQETTATLTERVYHAIQCLPIRFHQEKRTGDMLVRLTDDVPNVVGMISSVLPTIIIDGGRFFIILSIALFMNVKLTLLALLSIPLYILEARFYAGRHAKVQQESLDADSNIMSHASERLNNIKTIKAFGQERRETLSFAGLIRKRYRVAVKGRLLEVIQIFTNSLTLQMWSIFLTWYLGYQVVRGDLSIGAIVALMLYIEQLEEPVRAFIGLFTEWKTNLVSMHRLDEVLEQPSEETMDHAAGELILTAGKVKTSGLSFSYAPNEEILHEIDVSFPPQSFTAIVGSSGSGKSTLINLLLRFFDPTEGIIFVDDQNIAEVRIHDVRSKIGIVAQDATLFDGTIIDNILYGNEGKNRGDAMQVAQQAGAHDFIMRLPGAYDAPVGAEGSMLSGGQRQRIIIARTLLRNPSIIIFDEATSALDAESEFRIQETIRQLKLTKTVIVVAHRLSTIKMADTILVLDEGRFVERGQFEELFEKKGAFYRFYWRQFGGLATFRQQLGLEFERAARYKSRFCLAMLKARSYQHILDEAGAPEAEHHMECLEIQLEKAMRMGDNCARLEGDMILLLLPEITDTQLKSFFKRIIDILPKAACEELTFPITAEDLLFVGTTISHKTFKAPEELLGALKKAVDMQTTTSGALVITSEELLELERGERPA